MISVVILSYNTKDLTLKCLDKLYRSKGVELDVIVIDNASLDGSAEAIKKKFPQLSLISNKVNVGFAAGNNQGMEKAKGEHILLLNSDCFVEANTLSTAVPKLTDFDVLGCKLLNPDGTIQPSYGYFPSLWRIFLLMSFIDNLPIIKRFIKSIHVRDISRYQTTQSVDWVTGAFTLLKSEVFKKVGGIDEKYFMYGEEMEWMYRIKRAGFKIGFVPEAVATHLGGASTNSQTKMLVSELKGYLYWFSKHDPDWKLPLLKLLLILGTAYKALVWTLLGKGKTYQETFTETLKMVK